MMPQSDLRFTRIGIRIKTYANADAPWFTSNAIRLDEKMAAAR